MDMHTFHGTKWKTVALVKNCIQPAIVQPTVQSVDVRFVWNSLLVTNVRQVSTYTTSRSQESNLAKPAQFRTVKSVLTIINTAAIVLKAMQSTKLQENARNLPLMDAIT